MLPSLMIIDDFLSDPYAARKMALSLNYDPKNKKGNFPGLDSSQPLEIQGLCDTVGKCIGMALKPTPNTSHGFCRLTMAGEKGKSGVHIDPSDYSGILYLSLDEHCKGGTDFYRHRRTGLERVPTDDLSFVKSGYDDINVLIEDVVNRDTKLPSKWERVMRVPMRFNRLILFSPWMFHNAAPGFGKTPETARLVHLQFFSQQ